MKVGHVSANARNPVHFALLLLCFLGLGLLGLACKESPKVQSPQRRDAGAGVTPGGTPAPASPGYTQPPPASGTPTPPANDGCLPGQTKSATGICQTIATAQDCATGVKDAQGKCVYVQTPVPGRTPNQPNGLLQNVDVNKWTGILGNIWNSIGSKLQQNGGILPRSPSKGPGPVQNGSSPSYPVAQEPIDTGIPTQSGGLPSQFPTKNPSTSPVQQGGSGGGVNGCDQPANRQVSFSGYPATMTAARGSLTLSLVQRSGSVYLGGFYTNFSGQGGQYYQNGTILAGRSVTGSLRRISDNGNGYNLVFVLDRDGTNYPIGRIVDESPGTAYPHRAHVDLAPEICVTQYTMADGSGLISGGNGYIVLP